jgi:hypothetical protein
MAAEETRIGIWLNKSLVTALELPFAHEVDDGGEERWLLHVRGPGKVTARFRDGSSQGVDVQPGDFVIASRDAIYVSRTAPLPPLPERTEPAAAKRRTSSKKRSGTSRRTER